MICDLCDRALPDGAEVVAETPGQIVGGEFQASEPTTIRHEECEEF